MNTKKISLIVLAVVVLALLVALFLKIFPLMKTKLAENNQKQDYYDEICSGNFDLKKVNMTDPRFTTNDNLGYMLFNSTALEAYQEKDDSRCKYFEKQGEAKVNSLFSPDLCRTKKETIPALFSFAKLLKQGIPEKAFSDMCQSFLSNKLTDFKDNVPEDARDEMGKATCQSIYLSYKNGKIVLNNASFYDSDWPTAPTCDCLDADGKQRVCRNGLCRVMGFFSAVSKNDQSLCPKLTDAVVLPYCNLYFDDQTVKKYEDIFKESYCQELKK